MRRGEREDEIEALRREIEELKVKLEKTKWEESKQKAFASGMISFFFLSKVIDCTLMLFEQIGRSVFRH